MSNGLICGCITGINDKELSCHALCEICCNPLEFYDCYLVYYPPGPNILGKKHAANNYPYSDYTWYNICSILFLDIKILRLQYTH